jgi:hypothetical protein
VAVGLWWLHRAEIYDLLSALQRVLCFDEIVMPALVAGIHVLEATVGKIL